MNEISTHVLNTAEGRPAAGVPVELFYEQALIATARTNAEGRVPALLPADWPLLPGDYRLRFVIGGVFFPEVQITFRVTDTSVHYHIPLLVSPYGYTTYRGS